MRVEGADVLPRTLRSREHSSPMIVVQLARVTSGHHGHSRSPSCLVGGITGRDLSDSKLIVQAGEIDGRHASGRCKSPARAQIRRWPAECTCPPSRLKRDCASRATSTGGKCLVTKPVRLLAIDDEMHSTQHRGAQAPRIPLVHLPSGEWIGGSQSNGGAGRRPGRATRDGGARLVTVTPVTPPPR